MLTSIKNYGAEKTYSLSGVSICIDRYLEKVELKKGTCDNYTLLTLDLNVEEMNVSFESVLSLVTV